MEKVEFFQNPDPLRWKKLTLRFPSIVASLILMES